MARTPVFRQATLVGALSAQLRRPGLGSATSAKRRLRPSASRELRSLPCGLANGSNRRNSGTGVDRTWAPPAAPPSSRRPCRPCLLSPSTSQAPSLFSLGRHAEFRTLLVEKGRKTGEFRGPLNSSLGRKSVCDWRLPARPRPHTGGYAWEGPDDLCTRVPPSDPTGT